MISLLIVTDYSYNINIIIKKGYMIRFSILLYLETITVQAPQPPSAHPNFVPVRRSFLRKYQSKVHSGFGFGSIT